MQFDRNGAVGRTSQPVRRLKKLTRTVLIDSADRNTTTSPDAGDFWVYLPRTFENVTAIRLATAEIATPASDVSPPPRTPTSIASERYILLSLEGLNRYDETVVNSRNGLPDNVFAKIPNVPTNSIIYYNDQSYAPNVTVYNPPIARLDRLHVRWYKHGNTTPIVFGLSNNSITLEIEYLDNVFEEVSALETMLPASSYTR